MFTEASPTDTTETMQLSSAAAAFELDITHITPVSHRTEGVAPSPDHFGIPDTEAIFGPPQDPVDTPRNHVREAIGFPPFDYSSDRDIFTNR